MIVTGGGVAHDFATTSNLVADLLAESGFDPSVFDDLDQGLETIVEERAELLVLNTLRWRMLDEKFDDVRDVLASALSLSARRAILTHLDRGGGIFALHCAPICFDDWDEWPRIVGAAWVWGVSTHPPIGAIAVQVAEPTHPIVAGLHGFEVVDELYQSLDYQSDVRPLLIATHDDVAHPVLWAREALRGRVVYDALGHDERSFASPEHRLVIARAARWASRVEADA